MWGSVARLCSASGALFCVALAGDPAVKCNGYYQGNQEFDGADATVEASLSRAHSAKDVCGVLTDVELAQLVKHRLPWFCTAQGAANLFR